MEKSVNNVIDPKRVRNARIMLLGLLMVFLLPFIAATVMYYQYRDSTELTTSSNGELILPAVPLAPFDLQDRRDGQTIDLDWLKKQWTLVYLGHGECAEICERNLYHMRQIHVALAKEAHRVQRLVVSDDTVSIVAFIGDQYPGIVLADGSGENLAAVYRQFAVAVRDKPVQRDSLYLIDPLGNLVIRFSPDLDPRGILKDIKRVLRASRIG